MTSDPVIVVAISYGIVFLTGVVAGCRDRIVVFADLADVLITFAVIVGAIATVYVLSSMPEQKLNPKIVFFPLGCAVVAVFRRSYKQNTSIWAATLAVLTKGPIAVAAPLLVLQAAGPTGSTASRRARKRASALLLLTILAPLLIALVPDKSGMRRYLGVT